jgi:hypothetical protein
MKLNELPTHAADDLAHATPGPPDAGLSPLLQGPVGSVVARPVPPAAPAFAPTGAVVGELLALADDGHTPLVRHPGQAADAAALPARSAVDLAGRHVGRQVLLVFEHGDAARPIVIGVLQGEPGWPLADPPAQVQVDADGQRMLVSARDELVLRCGKACITLTRAGKVLIQGTYVSSNSSGVNRLRGGSVQLN